MGGLKSFFSVRDICECIALYDIVRSGQISQEEMLQESRFGNHQSAIKALNYSVTAANVGLDYARGLNSDDGDSWARTNENLPHTADLTLSGDPALVTKLHLTNRYSDSDTVKNCRLDYKDPSGSWQEGTTFQSEKTKARQSFDITSGVATTEWRIVVLDTYGGDSDINKIELEGIQE